MYRRLTAEGRRQVASGERVTTGAALEYIGDPLLDPPPVCSYEVPVLVRTLLRHVLCTSLARALAPYEQLQMLRSRCF